MLEDNDIEREAVRKRIEAHDAICQCGDTANSVASWYLMQLLEFVDAEMRMCFQLVEEETGVSPDWDRVASLVNRVQLDRMRPTQKGGNA
jgi:hypothetical protein